MWVKWIHIKGYCYNTTYHSSIKMSPFCMLHGYDPSNFTDLFFDEGKSPMANQF